MVKAWHRLFLFFFASGAAQSLATEPFQFSAPVWIAASSQMKTAGEHCALPQGIEANISNNNTAIYAQGDRLYFAFRTATHHHPKPPLWSPQWEDVPPWRHQTRMYVLSTPLAGIDWKHFPKGLCEKLAWRVELEVHDRLQPVLSEALDQDFQGLQEAPASTEAKLPRIRAIFGEKHEARIAETLRHYLESRDGEDIPPPSQLVRETRPSGLDYSTPYGPLPSLVDSFDLREPLFASFNGKLYFYFQQIEGIAMTFSPLRTWVMTLDKGHWSKPTPILNPGELVWEMKPHGGAWYLTSYSGGHYSREEADVTQIHFKISTDGFNWSDVDPARKAVFSGGGNEAAFDFDASGHIVGVLRHEDGGPAGWGSFLVQADPDGLGKWTHDPFADPRRYDSPRIFFRKGHWYLLARQNIGENTPDYNPAENGLFANVRRLFQQVAMQGLIDPQVNYPFDLAFIDKELHPDYKNGPGNREVNFRALASGDAPNKSTSLFQTGFYYLYEHHYYFHEPKRTALYEIFPSTREIRVLATLPSAGDTAFPSIVRIGLKDYLIANYSSALDHKNWSWRTGQENPTGIYLIHLRFND